eukprot:PITA_29627
MFQEPTGLPPKREIQHEIHLHPNCPLPNIGMYCMSIMENAEIKKQIKDFLDKGFIRPSTSPCGSPIVLIPKKDGTWRMCVDFRALNKITVKNRYPLPRIDDLLNQLKDIRYFTKLDLRSGYHQVRIEESDIWKTMFKTKQGLFEWLVMLFGLCNAPATFMRVMDDVLRPFLDDFVIVYLDDILIFSKSREDHVMHVRKVLNVLKKNQLFLKMSKCEFGKTSLVYLGHIVGGGALRINPSKIESIVKWPTPKSITEVRSFLGAAQYWRKFISNFSSIVAPMHAVTSVKRAFQWGGKQQKAFESLKEKISSASVLALPDLRYKPMLVIMPWVQFFYSMRYCYWPRMVDSVSRFIRGCSLCATSKPSNRKLGLYTPLPVPSRPWESISMDFVGGLPKSRKQHDYLYVVVDRFSKMCILMPCKKTITAEQTAELFFHHVWIHFGLPTSIISDRDSRFVGNFWSNLWEMMDTRLKKSTAFHPQTDGQTEVVNRTIVHLLRGYCSKHPKLWDEHLHYIQHAYNRAKHSSTNTSPFEACFGYLPKSPLDFILEKYVTIEGHSDVEKSRSFIERIQQIHHQIQEQLEKSQGKYKERHDKHRVDHKFQEGDEVWLYISKERMQGEGKNIKPIRYGPFKILKKVGNNAFQLDLPSYMQMYSVVNVENLL